MLDIVAAIALAAALLTGAAPQNGETTSAEVDRPIIVQGGGAPAPAEDGDRPIIVQGGQ